MGKNVLDFPGGPNVVTESLQVGAGEAGGVELVERWLKMGAETEVLWPGASSL
jgi:hypothetical protein